MKVWTSRVIAAGAIAGSVTANAYAADLPPAPVYRAPETPVAQVYNWTGIYLGVNGGYGIGESTPMSLYSDSFSAFDFSASGGLVGLTAGAQIQSGHTVIGVEADIDWADISSSATGAVAFNGAAIGTATLSSTVNSISTLRTRIGYAADRWLFYVTGGLAVTNEKSTLTGPIGFVCGTGAANSPPCSSAIEFHPGFAAGAGVEYGFTENLSARGEWIWVGAGAVTTLKENMLRTGLNWRFGM